MSVDGMMEYEENRTDPEKAADRFDEIMVLRMLLLDIKRDLRECEDPRAQEVVKRIDQYAQNWGKPDDCV